MHRSPSSADISTYDGCGEASKKLQLIANFILLTSSLVLIGTGKKKKRWKFCTFYIDQILITNTRHKYYILVFEFHCVDYMQCQEKSKHECG